MAAWKQDVEKGDDHGMPDDTVNAAITEPTTPKTVMSQTMTCMSTVSHSSSKFLLGSKALKSRRCLGNIKMPKLKGRWRSERAESNRIVRKIHERKRGYDKLATFLDCDENFMLYRRFGYLQSRLLLEKQDDLRQLELKLDGLENREFDKDPKSLMTRRHLREDEMKEKASLLKEIETTWNEYCVLIANASKMISLNKPTNVEHQHITQWMDNVKPLLAPENHFVRHKEDLITLRPGREYAWLDSGVETVLRWSSPLPIRRLFQSQDTFDKSDGSDGCMLYTRSRIENCVISIITCLVLALLIIPTYLLYHITTIKTDRASLKCMCILLVATLAFSACVSLCSRAKRHEILAASAAYCAVLVVFIGNFSDHLSER